MFTATETISKKLLTTWPESWKIFDDSMCHSIRNNLPFITGILLYKEKFIPHTDAATIRQELNIYLEIFGYKNMLYTYDGHFQTLKGYERGLVFVVFLTSEAMKTYLAEKDRWNKWATMGNSVFRGEQPKRPIHEAFTYVNIYKDLKKSKHYKKDMLYKKKYLEARYLNRLYQLSPAETFIVKEVTLNNFGDYIFVVNGYYDDKRSESSMDDSIQRNQFETKIKHELSTYYDIHKICFRYIWLPFIKL